MELDVPILDCTQRPEVLTAFNSVPEDVADSRAVGAELSLRTLRKGGLDRGEFLKYAAAGPIQIGALIEDNVDERHAEHRLSPNGGDLRHPLKRRNERERDLVFDELGGAPHPFGEHDHLVFRKIGDCIQRGVSYRPHTPADNDDVSENDNELVPGTIFDD